MPCHSPKVNVWYEVCADKINGVKECIANKVETVANDKNSLVKLRGPFKTPNTL